MADTKIDAAEAVRILAEKAKRSAELKARRDAIRASRAGETKADAFKRLINARTNNVLDQMATLKGTFDTNNYEFTPEQAAKVIAALENGLKEIKDKAEGKAEAKAGFSL